MSGSKLTQTAWIERFAIELDYLSNRFHKGDAFTMNTTLDTTLDTALDTTLGAILNTTLGATLDAQPVQNSHHGTQNPR